MSDARPLLAVAGDRRVVCRETAPPAPRGTPVSLRTRYRRFAHAWVTVRQRFSARVRVLPVSPRRQLAAYPRDPREARAGASPRSCRATLVPAPFEAHL
jgi:hypothetical protein